jgi:hypothetical protein
MGNEKSPENTGFLNFDYLRRLLLYPVELPGLL